MVVHDFAIVYLDDKFIGTFDRSKKSNWEFNVSCHGQCQLYVIVEAMGHINFNHSMEEDRKGLMFFQDRHGT
jgi:hypothetical protein